MLLLRKCWCDLFLLSAIQWCLPFENSFLFCTADQDSQNEEENSQSNGNQPNEVKNQNQLNTADQMNNANNSSFENETKHTNREQQLNGQQSTNSSPNLNTENVYLNEIKNLKECYNRFKQMEVDPLEFACLKAFVLFRPGNY